jgi:hypothetical protein
VCPAPLGVRASDVSGASEEEVIGMARRSEGQVVERHWKSGRGYALRFRAYGARQYLTLGLETEGWDRNRAEEELANVMADVRRGLWVPPTRWRRAEERATERGKGADGELLFGPFAQRVIAQREGEVSASYLRIMHWCLSHLLPYFADWPLAEIDVEAVDAYRAYKVEEAESIRRAIERRRPKLDDRGRPRRPLADLSGKSVLLLDDTWTSGGHAQSAAHALTGAGAQKVALVVIGRHVRRDYEPVQGSGESCGDILDALPESFDWTTCAVHAG